MPTDHDSIIGVEIVYFSIALVHKIHTLVQTPTPSPSHIHSMANRMQKRMSSNLYSTCQVQLAITSVWKVQFQHFQHFSVANNASFQMVCSTQKHVSTQNA